MTKDQIDKLKVGDVIRAKYAVAAVDQSAFTLVSTKGTRHRATRTGHNPILDAADLVTPEKVAKERQVIEVGDTVRVIPDPMTGTVYGNDRIKNELAGLESVVVKRVNDYGDVGLKEHDGSMAFNVHCLELVKKAVKDKYAVRKCYGGGGWTSCKVVTLGHGFAVAEFICSLHPDAKAAADAECARLNAEWRKKQEGE